MDLRVHKKSYKTSVHSEMVIFEDNHLLVLHKQPGILSQADFSGAPDLLTLGKEYIRKTYQKPGNVFLGLVHRLDRNVGGVMIFARTSKAASRLSEQIRKHSIKKEYLVVVEGIAKLEEELLHQLLKDEQQNISRVVETDPARIPKEKVSRLTYQRLETVTTERDQRELSLLRVELITGRSHQIRAQLSHIGHPIAGDVKYGSKILLGKHSTDGTKPPRATLALYAHKITFKHPTKEEVMSFEVLPGSLPPWNLFSALRR